MSEVITRKPAAVVKCPHCNKWQGSSRGLFTHVRMAHPGINEKPPTIRKEHPLDILSGLKTKNKPLLINSKFYTTKMQPITKRDKEDILTVAVLIPLFIHIFNQPDIKDILTSEGVNPKRLITALGKI